MGSIGSGQFMALQTFKKDGQGVITPVWVCEIEGKLYVWTDGSSWKVKRIRARGDVNIASSDVSGNPKSEWQSANAQVLEDETWITRVQKGMAKKYGFQFLHGVKVRALFWRLFHLFSRLHWALPRMKIILTLSEHV